MKNAKTISLPMTTKDKEVGDGKQFLDITLYSFLARALHYLTITRPDLTYVVYHICQFMHAPIVKHFNLLKKLLRYVNGTISL